LTVGGAICGPFLGIWLSLVSVKLIETGVAATLMGTAPIWVIPWVWILYGEKTSLRGLLGTIIAIGGIALLFQR
jgi:drug/metabolite transporter (DMT)-like permease